MKKIVSVLLAAMLFTSCGAAEKVEEFMDIDSNIGMNAPVLGSVTSVTNAETTVTEEVTTTVVTEKTAAQLLDERADEIASGMKTAEKIGQLLLARCSDDPVYDMETYHLGGITFYAKDFENRDPDSFKKLTDSITEKAAVTPFYAVDEEGGSIVRVSKYRKFRDEPFASQKDLFNRGGLELLEMDTAEKAELLLSVGLNFNLAPVADISEDENSYIYARTLGQNAETAAPAIECIVHTANEYGMASCLKHFPGYGENTDTHKGMAHDPREAYEFYNRDFSVFSAGINADEDRIPAVMVGHTVYDNIDPDRPASLSPEVIGLLRDKVGFTGVAVTDDLSMDAIKEFAPDESVYVMALLAGNDLLCCSDHHTAYNDLVYAYNDGKITDEILNEHLHRILVMKLQYGIIE